MAREKRNLPGRIMDTAAGEGRKLSRAAVARRQTDRGLKTQEHIIRYIKYPV
jgi:hypothetical protein